MALLSTLNSSFAYNSITIGQSCECPCSLLVSRQTAENIKKDLAAALPLEEPRTVLVRGINLNSAVRDFARKGRGSNKKDCGCDKQNPKNIAQNMGNFKTQTFSHKDLQFLYVKGNFPFTYKGSENLHF